MSTHCVAIGKRLTPYLRSFEGFPKPGVTFLDITHLLADPKAFSVAIDAMCRPVSDLEFDAVLAIDARGFIFGAPIAHRLSRGFVMVRKAGRLPGRPDRFEYRSEYDAGAFEVSVGLVRPCARYLFVDDVLAVGGVSSATRDYVNRVGGIVAGYSFLIEIVALRGRERLTDGPVHSVLAI